MVGVEALGLIIKERDGLLTQNDRMKTELALMRERTEQLEGRLAHVTAERDHYMKYAVELTVGLTNINVLIASTLEESRQSAYRPAAVPPPRVPTAEDDELKSLIARLPQGES